MTHRLHKLVSRIHETLKTASSKLRLAMTTLVLIATGLLPMSAPARNLTQITLPQLKQNVAVDTLGNATCSLSIKFPTDVYNNFKSNNPNFAVLLRRWQLEPQWADISNVEGHFDDGTTTLSITYKVNGLARTVRSGRWELFLPSDAGLQTVSVTDKAAVFSSIVNSEELGNIVLHVTLTAPESARNVQVNGTPPRVSFDADKMAGPMGDKVVVDCSAQVRQHVMSCLAKIYGNPKFAELWTARSVLRNQGDQPIYDYQVRFRIPGYTNDWSAWKKTHEVRPGQTVVDPYFPSFDLEKVSSLSGYRSATVEIETQYKRADNEIISETSSHTFQLLGRNDVVYSTMDSDSAANWYDVFNVGPYVVASFVNHEDPIIQQVAGWVSQQAGGPAASLNDGDAMKFLKALYDFCRLNNIAYQTSPDGNTNSQVSQHIKFGRDVLRNRAGTCVDLAILYASVCEAVGLHPRVYLIPGHAFPVVALPQSGQLVAIECTMFGKASFEDAVKRGEEERLELRKNRIPYFPIDTMSMKEQGVFGLELPELNTSALNDWGIKPIAQSETSTGASQGSTTLSLGSIEGIWVFGGELNGEQVKYGLAFRSDKTYVCLVEGTKKNGQKYEKKEEGKFELAPGAIVFNRPNGVSMARKVELKDGHLHVAFDEIKTILVFSKGQS